MVTLRNGKKAINVVTAKPKSQKSKFEKKSGRTSKVILAKSIPKPDFVKKISYVKNPKSINLRKFAKPANTSEAMKIEEKMKLKETIVISDDEDSECCEDSIAKLNMQKGILDMNKLKHCRARRAEWKQEQRYGCMQLQRRFKK